MTTYYVDSNAAGANDGSSWTNAFTDDTSAYTAANVDGDIIMIDQNHKRTGAVGTITFAANVRVIVVDKTDNSYAIMDGVNGYIGDPAGAGTLVVGGGKSCLISGIYFTAGAPASSVTVDLSAGADQSTVFEDCKFKLYGASTYISLGPTTSSRLAYVGFRRVEFNTSAGGQGFNFGSCRAEFDEITLTGSTPPSPLFKGFGRGSPVDVYCRNSDLSAVTGTLVDGSPGVPAVVRFENCSFANAVTVASTFTPTNLAATEVFTTNCAYGDVHYQFTHHNALGETVVVDSIYANDGAAYDGTNKCSWKITTTAYASIMTPYISRDFEAYQAAGSVTPSIEILRSGSATAYTNRQVWGEWSYQGNTGTPQGTAVDNKALVIDTPSNVPAGIGTANWTGEDATSWSGKLQPASAITVAEIGTIRARVYCTEPSTTFYVDPTVRVA